MKPGNLHFRRRTICAALAAGFLSVLSGCGGGGSGRFAAAYNVTDIGQFNGRATRAADVNNAGQIVGDYEGEGGSTRAFVYDGNGFRDLGTFGVAFPIARAVAINDAGQIVGEATMSGSAGQSHAFLYENGAGRDIHSSNGLTSRATAINTRGQIVGSVSDADGRTRGFLYENGAARDLGQPERAFIVRPEDINDQGIIFGNVFVDGRVTGFLYQNETLETDEAEFRYRFICANNKNQLVGKILSNIASDASPLFLYTNETETAIPLESRAGSLTEANDINEAGQVVGEFPAENGETHACLWENGAMRDLHQYRTPGSSATTAVAINDRGQILLRVMFPATGSADRVVLLTPAASANRSR